MNSTPRFSRQVRTLILAFEALATLVWARVALRLAPARVLRSAVSQRGEGGDPDPRLISVFRRVAAHSPIGNTCMHRSLALQWMLARRGIHARLCIGVGDQPRILPGHAWLEVGGRIVNDEADIVSGYTELPSLRQ